VEATLISLNSGYTSGLDCGMIGNLNTISSGSTLRVKVAQQPQLQNTGQVSSWKGDSPVVSATSTRLGWCSWLSKILSVHGRHAVQNRNREKNMATNFIATNINHSVINRFQLP
jgi:hypothetical protein